MRKIIKQVGYEPAKLRCWKLQNPNGTYKKMSSTIKQDIRLECAKQQFYLCAYCCRAISGNNSDCMNEHVVARKLDPSRELDFTNIVASCIEEEQCDKAHGCQPLLLTPFDDECETEINFKLSGEAIGVTHRANQTIDVLNLNKRALIEERKQVIALLLIDDEDLNTDNITYDGNFVQNIINELNRPSQGKLEAFSPIIINALQNWID